MSALPFNKDPILSYLGLPREYEPSPETSPVDFLLAHLRELPPHLVSTFTLITSPKQRTIIPTIRNRRLKYTSSDPPELSFTSARRTWPTLWSGRERRGQEEGSEEKAWANSVFLGGLKTHVGKLGGLLGDYEEEREAERIRTIRRERAAEEAFVPEEDSDSEDSDDDPPGAQAGSAAIEQEQETEEEAKSAFERLVRERFIYGLLESVDYDAVDWDERLDSEDDRDAEERWFDEEDEG
ncbi:hypothetical protein PLICRDRAFT_149156 [Plicaturopsis crispa FD-325 SS-3]|nr:hypothetical protein PLICRDRAFT_149156 [Plicaturopsis crispa FD-325 SS-3]